MAQRDLSSLVQCWTRRPSRRCLSSTCRALSRRNGSLKVTWRGIAIQARTYDDALARLSQLTSNARTTALFEGSAAAAAAAATSGKVASSKPSSSKPPPLDPVSARPSSLKPSSASPSPSKPSTDLNKAAIPEMRAWLARAGYSPADLARMRHIHVAGTKGKGSVCAFATALLVRRLQGTGRRVGTYTSPHLVSPRERIAVDGQALGRDEFAAAFFELWDRFEAAASLSSPSSLSQSPSSPSSSSLSSSPLSFPGTDNGSGSPRHPFFFRYLTIMAWHVFLTRGIHDVVMECGIGGEHDSTNVLPADALSAAVITHLGLDHEAMLGSTREEIAWHKAGVCKAGKRAFTRHVEEWPGVMDVLRERAESKGAMLVPVTDALVDGWGGVRAAGLGGAVQRYNQALAVLAVEEHLGENSDPSEVLGSLSGETAEGLGAARLRGRFEVLQGENGIKWLLDGAHTAESVDEVARWLAREHLTWPNERPILVFNQQDRDAEKLLEALVLTLQQESGSGFSFSHAVFTRNEPLRADASTDTPGGHEERDLGVQRRAAARMQALMPGCETAVVGSVEEAVEEAQRSAGLGGRDTGKVLVTGSLYLVGGVLRALEPGEAG